MVKKIFILLFVLIALLLKAQRINLGLDLGTFTMANTKTVFEEKPYYYLYAAPFSETDCSEEYIETGQIRLVRIWGISPDLYLPVKLGINVNYKSKNNFRVKIGFNIYNTNENIYYSFQPLMINMEDNFVYNNTEYNTIDNAIIVSRYINTYSLILTYDIPIKFIIKPFVLAGFTERVQLFSAFSSKTLEYKYFDCDNYVRNIANFEENLYERVKYDGFSHYANIGFGFTLYSISLSASWNTTIGKANSDYYISQNFITINLSYDLVSIPLFK